MDEQQTCKPKDKLYDQSGQHLSDAEETNYSAENDENDKVTHILNQVNQLSDVEKHLLYLQLPTEETNEDGVEDSNKVPSTLMAKRTDTAIKWIRQNYTETHDQCSFVPKEEVYERYREQCELESNKPLSTADFGKAMKHIFPRMTQRRLGQRGKSRYCYGLKKKEGSMSSTCITCNRDLSEKPSLDSSLYTLSCQIVCEWASQLLDHQVADIKSLSEFLVTKGFSYGKAATKFNLLSGSSGYHKQLEKERKSPRFFECQVFLQRKFHQKDIMRKPKEKFRDQERKRELAKMAQFTSTHPGINGKRSRKFQPRPSSVQSLTPSWASNTSGLLVSGHSVPMTEAQGNAGQGSCRLVDILMSDGKDCLTPTKRCQSASVVEKYSNSLSSNVLDLFHDCADLRKASNLLSSRSTAILSPSTTSDSTDTVMSSPATTSSQLGNQRLDSFFALHYKRNGDTISPDGETKRRCMTSLGVVEQENLNPSDPGGSSELTKLRPYSCPAVCSEQVQVKQCDLNTSLTSKVMRVNKDTKLDMWPVELSDACEADKDLQKENKVHFVQKPTVINGRTNNLHNVVSCPDFQQLGIDEVLDQNVKPNRPSSNILNSLLSSDMDLSWKADALKSNKLSDSTPHSVSSSKSDLPSHQLRVITDPSNSLENGIKLSNQSSRSAFVPVTSHKQLNCNNLSSETKLPHLPKSTESKCSESLQLPSKQSTFMNSDSLVSPLNNDSIFDSSQLFCTSNNFILKALQPVKTVSFCKDLSDRNKDLSPAAVAEEGSTQKNCIPSSILLTPYVTSQCTSLKQLDVVSGSSAVSATPVTRINTCTVSSPIFSVSSPVCHTNTAFVVTPPPSSAALMTPIISSSINSSLSTVSVSSIKSLVTSTTTSSATSTIHSSSVTPPKRTSKNRFTPIRPKLAGTRSTTPSPPKKDMRPVSTIIKEHRGIKLAKGLLVNLGNNYQGEVKLQMAKELLYLPPGQSKTSDLLVTINTSNNVVTAKSSATTLASPLLWPLASTNQHIKINDTLTSPVLTLPTMSSVSQPVSIDSKSLQVITDNIAVSSLSLCSPNITLRTNNTPSTLNKQLIILSPSTSHSSLGSINLQQSGESLDHNVSVGVQNHNASCQKFFPDTSKIHKMEGSINDSITKIEPHDPNEVKPFTADNIHALLTNQKSMKLSSTLLSELSQLVSAAQTSTQNNVMSSAFSKCSNQHSVVSESPSTNMSMDYHVQNVTRSLGNPSLQNGQAARKRKVGTDEHGNNKKINKMFEKDVDDDVFIVNIEDNKVNIPLIRSSPAKCEVQAPERSNGAHSSQILLTDTDKLLEMLPNKKNITVKETVMALKLLRAEMTKGSGSGLNSLIEAPQASPARCSDSSQLLAKDGRNLSLNVESLESDALIESEQALDLIDRTEVIKADDHKTSVAAQSTTKSNRQILSKQVASSKVLPNMVGMVQPDYQQPFALNTTLENNKIKNLLSGSNPKTKEAAPLSKECTQVIDYDLISKQSHMDDEKNSLQSYKVKAHNDQQHKNEGNSNNGKATNHPTLAQFLSTPEKIPTHTRSLSLTNDYFYRQAATSSGDQELPGDILDFITESMCHTRHTSDSFYSDNTTGQNSTLWRSMSVPNTSALNDMARIHDIKVSLAGAEKNFIHSDSSNLFLKSQQQSSQSHGIFLSPVGPAKMNRRLSAERSATNDAIKSQADSKSLAERPPSRLNSNVEKPQSKLPDDRIVSKILTDKINHPSLSSRSPSGPLKEDVFTDFSQGQLFKEKDKIKIFEKEFNKISDANLFCGYPFPNSQDAKMGDVSDGCFGVAHQPPNSGRINSSAVSTSDVYKDTERRDILSPSTIFMPVRVSSRAVSNASHASNRGNKICPTDVTTKIKGHEQKKLLKLITPSKVTQEHRLDMPAHTTVVKLDESMNSSSLQDSLHCIPTPPSSPSNYHVVDSNQCLSSQISIDLWDTDAQPSYNHTAGKDNQSSDLKLQLKTNMSPKVTSGLSPVPQNQHRSQPYNPHPSPPFTPSSQRCLASPRCPTPCPLTSSGCTTPISDPNSAPNRFVPIQLSGKVGNSAVGYIQPIRPVVTNVANVNTKPLLATYIKNKPIEVSNISTEPDFVLSSGMNSSQRKDNQNSGPRTLVLSLSGAIGSVSGKGMKGGWGGHEMSHCAGNVTSQLVIKSESDPSTTTSNLHLSSDPLPTYEEAVSHIASAQSPYTGASDVLKKFDSNENDGRNESSRSEPSASSTALLMGARAAPRARKKAESADKTKAKKDDLSFLLSAKNNISSPQPPAMFQSVASEQKLHADKSLRQLLSSKPSSLSVMLQSPAFTLGDANSHSSLATNSMQQAFKENKREADWKFSDHCASIDAPDSFHLSDLPNACYSGTTPNKTIPDFTGYSTQTLFIDQQLAQQNSHLVNNIEHGQGDALGETLDVLKNIDGGYFPVDDESY